MFCLKIWHPGTTFQRSCREYVVWTIVYSDTCELSKPLRTVLCAVLLCEPIRPLSVKQTDSCPQFPGFADNRTHATQCCDYLTFVSRGFLVSCVHLCLQLCSWWKRSDRQSMGSPGQTRSVLNAIRPIRTICTLPVRPSAACKYTQTHMFLPNTPNTYCIHHRAAFKKYMHLPQQKF